MNKDQPPHMWTYWRDKKGVENALAFYYPELLSKHPELSKHVYRMRQAQKEIDFIVEYENREAYE